MSQAEGYELFMCSECGHNIYEPGPSCPECGFSVEEWLTPDKPRRHTPRPNRLLTAARRDSRSRATPPTASLVRSLTAPNRRSYSGWVDRIHPLLANIAQHPFTLTNRKVQLPLQQIYDLLNTRHPKDEELDEFFNACNALLAAIEAQRPTPITTPQPTPHAPPTERELTGHEWRLLRLLEQALPSRPNLNNTGQAYSAPSGKLIATFPLPPDLQPHEARTRIERDLAGYAHWKSVWRTDKSRVTERRFILGARIYTIILNHQNHTAYLIHLNPAQRKT